MRVRLVALRCTVLLGTWILGGCLQSPAPPGRSAISLGLRWGSERAAGVAAVDSLTLEARDGGGAVLVPESPIRITPGDPPTFADTLALPAGTGRRISVRAFSHGDEYYRGSVPDVTVQFGQSTPVEVVLRNSLGITLQSPPEGGAQADTVRIPVVLSGNVSLRGLQLDVEFDARALQFASVTRTLGGPDGFDARELRAGAARVLFYGSAASQLLSTGGGSATACVLKFLRCPNGSCPLAGITHLSLTGVQAVSRHGLVQPADTAGLTLVVP